VATRTGGLPEVVDDGVTGFLAPVGDVDAMAARALEVLGDAGAWERMSVAARRSAVERYGVDVIIPRYEAYYKRILGR
jgi:glycosyltransferase involved in cell wall biosynthesis